MWIRAWFLRLWGPKTGCRHCGRQLRRCPACQGAWHAGCSCCRLGVICPVHQHWWTAT
jgi:hypothetical protein